MKFHRPDRVADQILRDVAEIVQREVKDTKIGFITFSRVQISKDLKFAKIFYTVMGSEKEQKQSIRALHRAKSFIQSKVGQRLSLRNTPEISFVFDEGLENSLRVNDLLRKIHEELEERKSGQEDTIENQQSD